MNKNYIYWAIAAVGITVVAMFLANGGDRVDELADISPTPDFSLNPEPSPTPTPKPNGSAKPTPGLIVKEVKTYEQLTAEFEQQGRWIAINADCTGLVPSNVTYHNNTEIMLDNTASTERHILKIGSREYLLEAGEWFLTTLSSSTLPVHLPIYCDSNGIELGDILLVK